MTLNILPVRIAVSSSRNRYLDILESAWQDHLKPRDSDAPTVISTFAGGGGSSLGYSMAGYRELLAVEWDDNAVATFKLNFPDVPVYHGDIAKLSVEQCLKLAGIQPGELDVLDGSPPCQGFSTAGKRMLDDPRNQLFREYVRLLRGLKPKVFVMENVSGMVKGKMKLVFAEILRELKASGYRVSARLLNAMYFYVPQSRERMIFIGVREDLGIEPSHPKAESRPINARTAIPGLLATRSQAINPWIDGLKPSATICKTEAGYQALITDADLEEAEIKKTWQMYRILTGKEKHRHFSLVKLNPDKPSPTITKDAGNISTGLVHPVETRKLTIPEIKRLASYPDDYQMVGNFKQKWERIGNSVPPLLMRSIANHIRQQILSQHQQMSRYPLEQ
jgi:DNA (cytosine-5)-methyltransferase 1